MTLQSHLPMQKLFRQRPAPRARNFILSSWEFNLTDTFQEDFLWLDELAYLIFALVA